jgi:predicted amidohydrolase
VYDPEGRPVARVADESPAWAVADLDLDLVRRTQRDHPMARHRLDSLGDRTRVVLTP